MEVKNGDNKCSICLTSDYEECMSCTFECNHWMCLECLEEYRIKYYHCAICRGEIDFTKLTINGGKSTIFLSTGYGNGTTISGINLDKMTDTQLVVLIGFKLNGWYDGSIRTLYSGVLLSGTGTVLSKLRIPLLNYQTIHCLTRLRGD